MYLRKPIKYQLPQAIFLRSIYLISKAAKSHENLIQMIRVFLGHGNEDTRTTYNAAVRAKEANIGHRGKPRKTAFLELILSTSKGEPRLDGESVQPVISIQEALDFAFGLFNRIGGTAGVVGIHVNPDGRVDIHLLVVNANREGKALETGLIHPRTKRPYRNILVVGRAILDQLHEELNLQRMKNELPTVVTMPQTIAKRIEERAAAKKKAPVEMVPEPKIAVTAIKQEAENKDGNKDWENGAMWEELAGLLVTLMIPGDDDSELVKKRKKKWLDEQGRLLAEKKELLAIAKNHLLLEAIEAAQVLGAYEEWRAKVHEDRRPEMDRDM